MKISTILDFIDGGHIALPEFQRGYLWNRDQVRGLFDSFYRRHPVGGLLVWATESKTATHRGDGPLPVGVVKLLLDGQQRITSLYGVVHGKPPKFCDGNARAFTGLRFHLETEAFAFYQPLKTQDDPLWIDLTDLMQKSTAGLGEFVARLSQSPAYAAKVGDYVARMSRLLGILDIELHVEEITGEAEEDALVALNDWVEAQGLPRGQMSFDYTDPDTGEQRAVFDLAWPDGVQEGLSQPVAVLLNEGEEALALASSAGFRCFADIEAFKAYVMKEVLREPLTA